MTSSVAPPGPSQRDRMLQAMVRAVVEKGYARVSVADVVALARVSRRTFYEQFDDKEDCFLAAYEAGAQALIAGVLDAMEGAAGEGWRAQLRAAIERYTAILAAVPDFARTFVVDVVGAGPRAVEARQRNISGFVTAMHHAVEDEDVDELVIRGLVGGLIEIVQHHILTEGAETLPALAPVLSELGIAVIEKAADRGL